MSPLSILILGFILGLKHATDADHVVAVTTIVTRQRKLRHAALVGITWGIGHTLMIIIVGIAIIIFHVSIPERAQLSFEFVVAVALVVLGLLNLTGIMKRIMTKLEALRPLHTHLHFHGAAHVHMHNHPEHFHEDPGSHEAVAEFIYHHGVVQLLRPFIVGLIHGLAGSAAVALLVLGSISDERVAVVYLAIFGVGTIVGMMLITTLLGVPIIAGSKKFARFDRIVTALSGVISVAYGLSFGYHIGIVDGLFRPW